MKRNIQTMKLMKILCIAAMVPVIALTSGCAAVGTAVAHANLQTKTMMSKSIFLDPVPNHDKVVYLQVRNTSDKSVNIRSGIREALEDKGYRVTSNLNRAYYIVQVNVLRFGRSTQTAAEQMMGAGYGGALEGGVAGALIAGNSGMNPVTGGLVGSVATTIVDNAVKDVTYYGLSDVKITVKSKPRHVYRTRVASVANKVNLDFSAAKPSIEDGLVKSISGIF